MQVYMDGMLVKSLYLVDHLNHFIEIFDVLHSYNMKLNSNKCAFGISLRKFMGFMANQRGIKANSYEIKAALEMEAP